MLKLPICEATQVVLVSPHYPENVGACARAIKTMGITRLCLVTPGRLALPEHEMAFKMAVRAWDVLESAQIFDSLNDAVRSSDLVFATTARRGQHGLLTPRQAAELANRELTKGFRFSIVLGNEKTGLSSADLKRCTHRVRIPMAGDQPSINLAQSVQLLAYEWFCTGLAERAKEAIERGRAPASDEAFEDDDGTDASDRDSDSGTAESGTAESGTDAGGDSGSDGAGSDA